MTQYEKTQSKFEKNKKDSDQCEADPEGEPEEKAGKENGEKEDDQNCFDPSEL